MSRIDSIILFVAGICIGGVVAAYITSVAMTDARNKSVISSKADVLPPVLPAISIDGIVATPIPEELRFGRKYTVVLDKRATMEVIFKSYGSDQWSRVSTAHLIQPNGNEVYFDIDNIADKILDPILVPLVQKRVNQVKQMDVDFMKAKPISVMDEDGFVWMRQK